MCQIFWFAGIRGSLIVTRIMNPFWMANLSANQAALAAGAALPHVYLQVSGPLSADWRRGFNLTAGLPAAA
jgi:cellobiose-specific phosphotransferase system component IIC